MSPYLIDRYIKYGNIGNKYPNFDLQFELLLREEGGNLNAPRPHGRTYLQEAIVVGNICCVKALLRVGAHLYRSESDHGPTAFHFAAAYGKTEILQEIINHCKLNNVDMRLEQRGLDPINQCIISPPLLLAGFHRNPESAMALILAGANVNAKTGSNMTILHYACQDSYPQARTKCATMIKMALEHGADVHLYCSAGGPQFTRSQPIHIAATCSFSEAIVLFLEHGASVDARDGDGQTPLLLAVKYFFEHFEYSGSDWFRDTSLALINSGADVCAKNRYWNTCMQILQMRVEKLLGRGATRHGTCAPSIQLRDVAAVIVALVGAGDYTWEHVPIGCPGLERNLLSVWENAPKELRGLFKRLEVDVQEEMRAMLQGLNCYVNIPMDIKMSILAAVFS